MEKTAQTELLEIFREAIRLSGAPIEMRVRRFASFIRRDDPGLAEAIVPLLGSMRGLREAAQPTPIDADSRLRLIHREDEVRLEVDPVFTAPIQFALDRVVQERNSAEALDHAGLRPIRSVLLSGSPGVGKTLAARWLARELSVPLLTLDLASVVSSYLGKTGSNIRSVLQHAQGFPCVLLLDEFDAIAKRRDDDQDVGELKRLVTVLLQTIDEWPTQSLLVAATNHRELLDPAVWRRFDLVLEMPLPGHEERRRALAQFGVPSHLAGTLAKLTEGESLASVERAVRSARKRQVLDGISFEMAVVEEVGLNRRALHDRVRRGRRPKVDEIQRLQIRQLAQQGLSARDIAAQTEVSHTTVNRILKSPPITDG